MHKLLIATLLSLAAAGASAGLQEQNTTAPEPTTEPTTEPVADPATEPKASAPGDAASFETREPPHGKSRIERQRERCGREADAKSLTGEARADYVRGCAKR